MKTITLVALASVVFAAGTMLAPDAALAGGRHGHGKGLHASPPKFFPKHHHHHGFKHHGFRHRHGFGVGIVAPPVVIYSAPSYEYVPPPPAYTPTYVPPPAYSYAPPPMQRVVEFPTGRYELHGDGVTTAYRWVWIPNPPTSPPVEEPPVAPPPPVSEAPAPVSVERTRRADIYRWTDDAGVVHITDRLEKVPEAYRSKVTKTQS